MNQETNTPLNENFHQVCVWPATIVGEDNIKNFEAFFYEEVGVRIQFLEEVTTSPDIRDGMIIDGTGGRVDVLFAVHDDDVPKFAIERFTFGIRFIEDVLMNGGGSIWPIRVRDYWCWDKGDGEGTGDELVALEDWLPETGSENGDE